MLDEAKAEDLCQKTTGREGLSTAAWPGGCVLITNGNTASKLTRFYSEAAIVSHFQDCKLQYTLFRSVCMDAVAREWPCEPAREGCSCIYLGEKLFDRLMFVH